MLKKLKFSIILSVFVLITSVISYFYNHADALLYSVLTVFCIVSFSAIYEKTHFINKKAYYSVIVFILLSIFLGRIFRFYFIFSGWDKILHFLSGFILFEIGSQFIGRYNIKYNSLKLWFAFLFASSFASFWEIYEFAIDLFLKTDAQGGSLTDTMLDIILGTSSSLIFLITKKIKNRRL